MRVNPSSFDSNIILFYYALTVRLWSRLVIDVGNHIFWFDIYGVWAFDSPARWMLAGEMNKGKIQWACVLALTAHTHSADEKYWYGVVVRHHGIPSGLNGISGIGHLSNVIPFIFIDCAGPANRPTASRIETQMISRSDSFHFYNSIRCGMFWKLLLLL